METGPMTRGEKLMYNVLSRANLVQYYHAFIAQGGDDVYQLCESGEDEFLEIMALVGMASKPLHVRRLQKTLQEFLTNPDLFKENNNKDIYHHRAPIKTIESLATSNGSRQTGSPNQKQNRQPPPPQQHILQTWEDSPVANSSFVSSQSNSYLADSPNSEGFGVGGFNFKMEGMPVTWTCRLNDEQRTNIEQMTAEFAKDLPMYAPKPLNMKKPVDKEIEDVLNIPEDDPTRMDLIRKYSAIYGRFDSKRKVEKQMNFHEMCVNEAAAQLDRKSVV